MTWKRAPRTLSLQCATLRYARPPRGAPEQVNMGVKSMSSSRSAEGSRGQIDAFAEPLGQFLDLFRSCLGTLFRRPCELQTDVTSRARLGATSRLDRSRPGDPELVNTVVNLMSTFSLLGRSRAVPGAEIGSKMPPLRSSFWTRRKVQNRAEKKMPQDKEYSSEKKTYPGKESTMPERPYKAFPEPRGPQGTTCCLMGDPEGDSK